MTDTQPMQAMPDDAKGGQTPPATGKGGESEGGAYPNPHSGKGKQSDVGGGFMGHGGQSEVAYSGTGDAETDDDVGNPNAVTK